jgi:hypothetical protein
MLSRVEALHTAARRYCIERADLWRDRILEQPAIWGGEEFVILRRHCCVLDAIGDAVEAFTPDDSASLDEVRKLLLAAAALAVNELPPFERKVIQDEGSLFAAYLQGLSDSDLARVESLPFRRRLRQAESARLWVELKTRWGVGKQPMWYPFDRYESEEPPPHARVFKEDPFRDDELLRRLREVLAALGVSRLWELRAWSDDQPVYELDLGLLEPVYGLGDDLCDDLDERYWTDASFDWLIYASHEETVTIAGAALLNGLRAAWPAWRVWRRFVLD